MHYAHEVERSRRHRYDKVERAKAEVEARYRRNLLALLPVVSPGPCDFPGCVE